MKLGIMQPYFFPYLGYWQLIAVVDKFIVLDDVNFIKQGWIHKNNILLEGVAKPINLTLNQASSFKEIRNIEISSKFNNKKILNTLMHAYKKAPYFNQVYPLLVDCLSYSEMNLSKYLAYGLNTIAQYLQIDTQIVMTSSIYAKKNLFGEDRIIDICKGAQATTYINAIGGQDLYDEVQFSNEGIDLKFINMNSIIYQQFSHDFVANLSIIDVMMFNSVDKIQEMLCQFDLK